MIGILNAYEFDPQGRPYQQHYTRLMNDFVARLFPGEEIRDFKVALGDWPEDINLCSLWMITGSAKGAYDSDEWIGRLKGLVVDLDKNKKKLIGICFGHQLVAQALGGRTEKSAKGWGIGIKSFSVTSPRPWMSPQKSQVSILFSHQDQVTILPRGAAVLAADEFCPYQILQIGNHILSMQGHPEFSVEFAKERLMSRRELVAPDTFERAMASLTEPSDAGLICEWIRGFRKI